MNKFNTVELSNEDKKIILKELYGYFKDWYDFEKFCKLFLKNQRFDEVEVTKRTGDGGIDLNAVRTGFDSNGLDAIKYKIQVKRLKPGTSVKKDDVKALRGNLNKYSQEIGIFITTGKYTKGTYEFVEECNPKDIILIDGIELVQQCIDIGLGFSYKPIIDIELLDKSIDKLAGLDLKDQNNDYIDKFISKNDIRTQILPIPNSIYKRIDINSKSYRVRFNDNEEKVLNINRQRKYFGGVVDIYRKYGLIAEDKSFNPKESYWNINNIDRVIDVHFSN